MISTDVFLNAVFAPQASYFSLRGQRKVTKRKAARRLALWAPCASRSGEGFSDRPSLAWRKTRGILAAPPRACSLLICDARLRLREWWVAQERSPSHAR